MVVRARQSGRPDYHNVWSRSIESMWVEEHLQNSVPVRLKQVWMELPEATSYCVKDLKKSHLGTSRSWDWVSGKETCSFTFSCCKLRSPNTLGKGYITLQPPSDLVSITGAFPQHSL